MDDGLTKMSFSHYGIKVDFEVSSDIDCYEMTRMLSNMLITMGYAPGSIIDAFEGIAYDMAESARLTHKHLEEQ